MSDSEYEEEEILIFADFKDQVIESQFVDGKASLKIIGLDEEQPIAELGGSVFKGSYDYAMGTHVFFKEDLDAKAADRLFEVECNKNYKYIAKTNKVINFERIYLDSIKQDTDGSNAPNENTEKGESVKLQLNYQEALNLFPSHEDIDTAKNN